MAFAIRVRRRETQRVRVWMILVLWMILLTAPQAPRQPAPRGYRGRVGPNRAKAVASGLVSIRR